MFEPFTCKHDQRYKAEHEAAGGVGCPLCAAEVKRLAGPGCSDGVCADCIEVTCLTVKQVQPSVFEPSCFLGPCAECIPFDGRCCPPFDPGFISQISESHDAAGV